MSLVSDPLNRTRKIFIDVLGRLSANTDPLGNRTRYDYNANDQVNKITDALNAATSLDYDGNGNLILVKDAKGGSTSFRYTARNWLLSRTDPLSNYEDYTYDPNGNLKTFIDRRRQNTTTSYDVLNRRSVVTYADGSSVTYTWDAGDRLRKIVDSAGGTVDRDYDNFDRLTKETSANGSVSYTYDKAHRRSTMTVAGQPSVTYTYDDANRLIKIEQNGASVQLAYDNANRPDFTILANGVMMDYTYDDADQLKELRYSKGASILGNLTYGYDAAGRRTSLGGSLAKLDWPEPMSASYNAANRMTTLNGVTLSYDPNGNLLSDGSRSLVWDVRNRLAQSNGSVSALMNYDPFGRRSAKTINGVQTQYLYDGLNPVQEFSGTAPKVNLLTGLKLDEVYRRSDGNGSRDYLTDALGSTLGLTDAAGTIKTRYSYSPYGKTSVSGEVSSNSFQYTGRENDGTGLYYYRARYYSPDMSRFISEDPIGFAGGDVNLYAYVGGNPISRTDPLGLEILVCNRKVDGFPFVGNHAYAWDTTTNTAEGMRGSAGYGAGSNEKGNRPGGDACNEVKGSKGKEKVIMDFMRENQNNGVWAPGINDCHNAVKDAVENAGLKYPGAPGGRVGAPR